MRMQVNAVRPYQRWNWTGDEIVHNSTIPAARRVPNSRTTRYPIDIREFLSIEDNAVVRSWLQALISKLPTSPTSMKAGKRVEQAACNEERERSRPGGTRDRRTSTRTPCIATS
jgi:hypothetical protein